MLELFKKHIKEAKEFWSNVADKNGWSMDGKGVTVWVDDNNKVVDSLYNSQKSEASFIVNSKTEEIIKVIKH